ncbi:MAG: hypothetical protein JXR10_01815 [Cyclobacteriaceae bacterium]
MKVKISYQTLQLPPPHAFAYTLELDFQPQKLGIKYDLEFLNREEVSAEELEEEGYTENDNFSWSGELGEVWVQDLQQDIMDAELEDESDDFNIYLHMEISDGEETVAGLAVMAEDWDYRLQELIQAIYEKAGIESPLQLKFIHLENGSSEYYEVKASFEHQTAQINKTGISWEDLHELMSDVYAINFEEDFVDKPKTNGLWVDPNGLSGYQLFDSQAGPKGNQIKKRILDKLNT